MEDQTRHESAKKRNHLLELKRAGQSIWLDFLRRRMFEDGSLEAMIREDGVGGVTSNPSIFRKAIAESDDYDIAIRALSFGDQDPLEVFYDLALGDIETAADIFRPVYEVSGGKDGFVSFQLEPRLAQDTEGTVGAAYSLFNQVARPNLMIKVPGTPEGIKAVQELTRRGVNVNITLLFSIRMYEAVARAYMRGLEQRLADGQPIDHIYSVASFFVSRVDGAVDPILDPTSPLKGRVGVANARVAYSRFRRLFSGSRWARLSDAGAQIQRPLWASTATKNPIYRDVLYVEELIAPDTVTTLPAQTLAAFREHGRVSPQALTEGIPEAEKVLAGLRHEGVDLPEITDKLLEDGLRTFEADLDDVLQRIAVKLKTARSRSAA